MEVPEDNESFVPRRKLERKRTIRRIYRCQTRTEGSVADVQQRKDPGETSNQTMKNFNVGISQQSSDNNYKAQKIDESFPRFGPLYSEDQLLPVQESTKQKAWIRVLDGTEKNHEETQEEYVQAIRNVEEDIKVIYVDHYTSTNESRLKLVIDSCFFLQLVLLILGCGAYLGYRETDPIFGKPPNKLDQESWIEAMFIVGNQIPLVVLKQFMNLTFFKEVVEKGNWDRPPSNLWKRVLFEQLVLPRVKRKHLNCCLYLKGVWRSIRGSEEADPEPTDVIHCLHNLVLGPLPLGHSSGDCEFDVEIDLADIANVGDTGRYVRGYSIDIDYEDGTSSTADLNLIGSNRNFPSATELKGAGITFKKLKEGGVRSIDFKFDLKSGGMRACIHLPPFPIDDNTEKLFRNLMSYEICQPMWEHRREVCAYIKFMGDMIRTVEDVKLLQKKRIIQGKPTDARKLPEILSKLNLENKELTHEFCSLRRKIRDYSSPWALVKGVISLVAFLTLVQTLFVILAYFRPPKT